MGTQDVHNWNHEVVDPWCKNQPLTPIKGFTAAGQQRANETSKSRDFQKPTCDTKTMNCKMRLQEVENRSKHQIWKETKISGLKHLC